MPETTTTTQPSPTTLGGGGWASVAAITSPDGLLGWWDGSAWFRASDAPDTDVTGRYQVFNLGERSEAEVTEVSTFCDIAPETEVPYPEIPEGWEIGLSAPWAPAEVELIDGQPDVYVDYVRDYLASVGRGVETPRIAQMIRVDLEGDGTDEVFVVAEQIEAYPSLFAAPGDYSLVLLRSVSADDSVETRVIEEFYVEEPGYVLSFRVTALADLNGDGVAEIVLSEDYYEGAATTIWETRIAGGAPAEVLGVGCGV